MKTNKEIETLNEMIKQAEMRNSALVEGYKKLLLGYWTKIFDNDKQLQKDAENAQNASEYGADETGIYSWYRVKTNLEDFAGCRDFLENWLSDNYCLTIDWENDCFVSWQGDDNLMIQDDTRRDNGVWQSGKLVIDETEYKDEDGEIDIEKRNSLIEEHMEKTGCFPGVFRITQYGDVFHVNTQTKKAGTK